VVARLLALRREAGQVVVLFALMLPVLLGLTAMVVDLGNVFVERRTLQKAADAAALAASQDPAHAPTLAPRYTAANGGPSSLQPCPPSAQPLSDGGGCYTWPYKGDPDKVEIVITKSVTTLFAKIVGVSRFKIKVRAVAMKNLQTTTTPGTTTTYPNVTIPASVATSTTSTPGALPCGLCLLGSAGISMNGSPSEVRVNGADVITNGGISTSGHPKVSGQHIIVHGSVSSGGVYSPTPTQSATILPDPLAYLPAPAFNDHVIPPDAPASGTLTPGTYKNVNPNGRTLSPGLYVITGTLSGAFTGVGVLLYFPSCASHPQAFPASRCSSSTPGGYWSSDARWTLSPPLAGNCAPAGTCVYTGLSVFYDRDYVVTFPLQGNTGSSLTGTIYGTKIRFDFGGGPSLTTTSAIIAGSYNGGGNPLLTVNYDQGTNVQPPQQTITTTTTPATTESGSTVTTPPVTSTVGTGSNLDE
jgi:hypothetical protein